MLIFIRSSKPLEALGGGLIWFIVNVVWLLPVGDQVGTGLPDQAGLHSGEAAELADCGRLPREDELIVPLAEVDEAQLVLEVAVDLDDGVLAGPVDVVGLMARVLPAGHERPVDAVFQALVNVAVLGVLGGHCPAPLSKANPQSPECPWSAE